MPIKINGSTSGSTTITAPATGTDETIELSTALAAKAPLASPTFTGNVVWSGATLRASTATVATNQTCTSQTYIDLTTSGPAVTVTTGTTALVILSAAAYGFASNYTNYIGFAVSGATTVSASDSQSLQLPGSTQARASSGYIITGLTAGSNTFTLKYRNNINGGMSNFLNRTITVIDLGS